VWHADRIGRCDWSGASVRPDSRESTASGCCLVPECGVEVSTQAAGAPPADGCRGGSVALADRRRCDLYKWTDSDAFCEHFECDPEPVVSWFVGGELVVTAPQVLHESVSGGQGLSRPEAFQSSHRAQPCFEPGCGRLRWDCSRTAPRHEGPPGRTRRAPADRPALGLSSPPSESRRRRGRDGTNPWQQADPDVWRA
jgi:hypothetical protein